MTWNGFQGFRTPIQPDSFVVDNIGTYGSFHQERDLTCERLYNWFMVPFSLRMSFTDVEFSFSGHMTPRKPIFSYR